MTLIVQLAPAESEAGQVLVSEKLPVRAMVREDRVTLPEFVTVTVCGALWVETVCPEKVRLVGERLTSGACPVPLRLTLWGLFMALSVSVRAPLRGPTPVGVKVTLMMQLALGATEPPQVLVWAKSPLALIARGARATLPEFVNVMVCEALWVDRACPEKVRLVAERLTTAASPVPLRVTVWGLLVALSVSVRVPVRGPGTLGVKVTPMVQAMPGLTGTVQLLVWAKSPVVLIVRGVRPPVPVLVNKIVCGALAVAGACPAKVRLCVESVTTGASAVPLSDMICGLLLASSVIVTEPV